MPLVSSFVPEEEIEDFAARAGAVGVYAEFRRITDEHEAFRRFAKLTPKRQADHIAEYRRGRQFEMRARGIA